MLSPTHAVLAAGDLDVTYLGAPLSGPVFDVHDMAPGEVESRAIDVANNGSAAHVVAVKGVKTAATGDPPLLESVLTIVISEGGIDRYGGTSGVKTVADFFTDSTNPDGILLTAIAAGDATTYDIDVTFPPSAGNEFQDKSVVFNLTFGTVSADHILINEVYYDVADDKGLDSPKDRGILAINGNNAIIIQDNGAGSVNTVKVDIRKSCRIIQQNNANIRNFVDVITNTGGNSANNNPGSVIVTSGNANVFVTIMNIVNSNIINFGSCNGGVLLQNHEWVELYNPTDATVNLKNWSFTDNSGQVTKITGNRNIPPHSFALITKASSTWGFWSEPSTLKIFLAKSIGDGLDDGGDHLFLKNNSNTLVDAVGWGNDTAVWNPAVPPVTLGSSIERMVPGFDTDDPSDWEERFSPTPGL